MNYQGKEVEMIKQENHAQRREKLFAKMELNSVSILMTAPEQLRNGDVYYPYRQDSNFYYLTGFTESEAAAVLIKGNKAESKYILFSQEHDEKKELWLGKRIGQKGAIESFGADEAYPISDLENQLLEILKNKDVIYFAYGRSLEADKKITSCLNQLRSNPREGFYVPDTIINVEKLSHEMRLIKEPAEIEVIQKAANISAKAHLVAMQACSPKCQEGDLERIILHEFQRNGSKATAFNTIVAGGGNASILHYEKNNAELKAGDLVLIDAGCEYQYYAGDISRTFPVDGRFTTEQRAVYEIVLKTQLAIIEQVKPGTCWDELRKLAAQFITEGLVKLGILEGPVEGLLKQKAYKQFYMHDIGHWLGLNVHDDGAYKIKKGWRELAPGMVLTIEPGIYISTENKKVNKKWRGIGVRIEDTILVTEGGNRVLTCDVPKEIDLIEKIVGEKRDEYRGR